MSRIQVREVTAHNKELLKLIAKLDQYLYECYPAEKQSMRRNPCFV
ncbi:hypothetical protein [Paenibacillus xylaniclasticus]|nr:MULTISPECIES: hypothetical protein [Paenibacillus]